MVDVSFFLNLVTTFGYLGIFAVSLIGSLSLFIPLPTFLVVVTAGAILNPVAVGIVAGLGAAIGELLGYGVGIGINYGHKKISHSPRRAKKEKTWMKLMRKWFHRKLGPVVIFIFAITPLPDKIIGVFCGLVKYDVKKFFLATLAGKIVLHVVLAYIGFYGLGLIESFL